MLPGWIKEKRYWHNGFSNTLEVLSASACQLQQFISCIAKHGILPKTQKLTNDAVFVMEVTYII